MHSMGCFLLYSTRKAQPPKYTPGALEFLMQKPGMEERSGPAGGMSSRLHSMPRGTVAPDAAKTSITAAKKGPARVVTTAAGVKRV